MHPMKLAGRRKITMSFTDAKYLEDEYFFIMYAAKKTSKVAPIAVEIEVNKDKVIGIFGLYS